MLHINKRNDYHDSFYCLCPEDSSFHLKSSCDKYVLCHLSLILNAMTLNFFCIIPYVFALPWLPKLRYVFNICGCHSVSIIRVSLGIRITWIVHIQSSKPKEQTFLRSKKCNILPKSTIFSPLFRFPFTQQKSIPSP